MHVYVTELEKWVESGLSTFEIRRLVAEIYFKDWKKSQKIVSLEKNLALQAQNLLWRLNLFANEDSSFGSMFLEFR